ncbi:translation initiation factor IF-2-like isoform X8 [Panicum virgatum]|uniref:Agenet domain-containing protein n=1 Tax=Panicum virgatum TaxID=38727 RepID=A0A8T0UIP0_PANVG|nr:translation initiation factor IF-2-like isoform X8 [Panicum virgatum]KAG2624432.1 hypothetical protein PVAP13_3KG129400 [Panicum virgatum]
MKPPQWTELQRFNPGDLVEVVPDEPGEQGAHYAAVVVERSTQPRGYTVEYDDLVEREGSDRPLREVVPAQILRPHPPPRCTYSGEAPGEHAAVDAFLDVAWWLAVYLGVVDGGGKVRVCFPDTREVMNFDAADVRPHFEWGWGGSFRKRSALGMNVSSNDEKFGGAWFEVARSKGTASPSKKQQPNNPSWKSTTPKSSPPPRAAPIKKRKRRADGHGRPDLAPSLVKKHRSPKLRPSEENKLCKSSSKGIYPDLHEKHLLRDAPRPDEQAKPAPQPEPTPAPAQRRKTILNLPAAVPDATISPHTRASDVQNNEAVQNTVPEVGTCTKSPAKSLPTPAPAQRRKTILNLSLPMIQPAAVPDATVSLHTRASDVQNNEAVQNTVPEVGTCTKSPAKSLPTPLDNIIKELKDCREQWLQAQSQLDHSATKAKEMEGQVAKLRAAHEADAQHLREVMNKQASLEQRLKLKDKEIEDLKEKLVDLDEQKSCVEAELPRGAVMAASHALGVLKNHVPDLDIGILSKGYACTPAEAQALADQVRPIVEPFIERLGLSVSVVDAFVGRTYMCRAKEG